MKAKTTDNYGKPRQLYLDRIAAMDEKALRAEANNKIWLSAYANNNARSDFHWQCDAVYDECKKRDRLDIYTEEHAALSEQAR